MRERFMVNLPRKWAWSLVVAWILLTGIADVACGHVWNNLGTNRFDAVPRSEVTAGSVPLISVSAGDTTTAYVIVAGSRPRDAAMAAYHGRLVAALNTESTIRSVSDLTSDPLTAGAAESKDSEADYVIAQLEGSVGSRQARESLAALHKSVESVPRPAGIGVSVDGPAVTMDSPLNMGVERALVGCLLILTALGAWGYRRFRTMRMVLLMLFSATVAVFASIPVLHWSSTFAMADLNPTSATVLCAVVFGLVATGTAAVVRERTELGGGDTSMAGTGNREPVRAVAAAGAAIAVVAGVTAFSPLPAIRGLAAAAGIGAVVATVAALTLVPALLTLTGARPITGHSAAAPVRPKPPRTAVISAAVLVLAVLCALPLLHAGLGDELHRKTPARDAHFGSAQFLPTDVAIEAAGDLRTPAGLIAIDRLTRRLMAIPGVRTVQSASWPAGEPWSEATFAHQAGVLGNQLQTQTADLLPQVSAIETMSSTVDRLSAVISDLQRAVAKGNSGLDSLQNSVVAVNAGTKEIGDAVESISTTLDPVRRWMDGVPNCAADALCSAISRVTGPLDAVQRGISTLSGSADQIQAGSRSARETFAAAPAALAQMKDALGSVRSVLSGLRGTIQSIIPEVVQLAAYLRRVSTDFDGTGDGNFYLPQTAIDAPSYGNVKRWLFSPDGRTTHLIIHSDAPTVGATPGGLAAEISAAVDAETKYGALADSRVTITGVAAIAASLQSGGTRTVTLMVVGLALAALLTAAITGRIRPTLISAVVAAGACAVAIGLNLTFWQYLMADPVNRTAALAGVALAVPLALAYNIVSRMVPGAASFLTGSGLAMGIAWMTVADTMHKDLGQAGLVVVTTLGVNALLATAVSMVRVPSSPATNR